ncbi:MAG: MFS transporter [Sphingomonadales bacterium]|nr:MFS transporter [Sphingomonadales bacterium]
MNSPEPIESNAPARISELKLFLFALSSAAVVANGYYIHPLITPVAEEFGVSGATIGLAPALNQIALALGILLLLPLGDRINNRKLVTIFVVGQFFAMLAMALSTSFTTFVAASSLLGFVTIAPYLLPAYVTQRVAPGRIGHVTGIMTAGVTLGILGSRVGGGLLGHYFGWRSAYWVGVASMALLVILLPLIMERKRDEKPSGVEPPR